MLKLFSAEGVNYNTHKSFYTVHTSEQPFREDRAKTTVTLEDRVEITYQQDFQKRRFMY